MASDSGVVWYHYTILCSLTKTYGAVECEHTHSNGSGFGCDEWSAETSLESEANDVTLVKSVMTSAGQKKKQMTFRKARGKENSTRPPACHIVFFGTATVLMSPRYIWNIETFRNAVLQQRSTVMHITEVTVNEFSLINTSRLLMQNAFVNKKGLVRICTETKKRILKNRSTHLDVHADMCFT